jgi:hypothetical protein
VYEMLVAALPERQRILLGQRNIVDYLHGLGVRRPNGQRVTWNQLRRWRRLHGFPCVPGFRSFSGRRYATPAITSDYAVTAWLLTRDPTNNRLFAFFSPRVTGDAAGSAPVALGATDG